MQEYKDNLDLTQEVELEQAPASLFLSQVMAGRASSVRIEDWSTSATSLAGLGDPVLRVRSSDHEQAFVTRAGTLIHLALVRGRVFSAVAGHDEAAVDSTLEWLRRELPVPDPTSSHEVNVTFWTYGPHGPQPSWRSISVPGWDDIQENYSSRTRERLEQVIRGFEPARGGQLILWHGKVGTGKTYALRALAWEWREWCEFHYIVDPDAFFGEHADYLMSVLLQPTDGEDIEMDSFSPVAARIDVMTWTEGDGRSRKPWKLLILEDTGELLTADAKALIGQGLSRFLNVVDGFIGQGLRVLVLVTTNEEIRKFHPAVSRPGRCAANVEFSPLSVNEAKAWLERHGKREEVPSATTLAALYAMLGGHDVGELEHAPGFAG